MKTKLNKQFEKLHMLNQKCEKLRQNIKKEHDIDNKDYNRLYRNYLSLQHYKNKKQNDKVLCSCGKMVAKYYLEKHKKMNVHNI